jgi:hypothetical protein
MTKVLDNGVVRDATPAEEAEIAARATAKPTEADYVNAVQTLLDTTAQTRHYDNILSACTYVGSTVQKFSDEGTACRNWRDAVWAKCYDILAQVEAGTLAQPTVAELLAMLPTIAWPA